MSSAPSAKQAASAANGRAIPTTNRAAPIGGAMSWLVSSTPPERRAFATPEVLAPDEPRQEAPAAHVGERLRGARAGTARRGSAPMFTLPVTIVVARSASTSARARLTTTMIRIRSTRSATTPAANPNSSTGTFWARSAIETRSGSRVSRGDQQRAGRERDAVPDVGQDGRREQPAERASEARRSDRLGQADGGIGHRGSLPWPPAGATLRADARQRGGTVPSCRVTMPPVSGVQRTSTRPASPMISAIRSGDG